MCAGRHSSSVSWTTFARHVWSRLPDAQILHQDLRLPDERARLRAGRAVARRARLRAAPSEKEADVVLLNTCSVRDMAEQKAIGKMGMLGRLAKRTGRRWSSASSAAWRRRAARTCCEMCRTSISSSARRNSTASPTTWMSWSTKNGSGCARADRGWTIRVFRSWTWRRKRVRRRRSASTPARAAGDGVCLDHAGLQHALHLLHRAADARGGA